MIPEQNNIPLSPKGSLRATRILHTALVIGLALFAVILVVLNNVNNTTVLSPEDIKSTGIIFLAAAAGIALFCLFWATSHYKKKIQQLKSSSHTLMEKLNLHRSALILYMAPCEGAGIFACMVFFLTGNYISLGIAVIMLIAMLLKKPAQNKLIEELELDWKDQQELV